MCLQGNLLAGPPSLRPRLLLPFVHRICCIVAVVSSFVSLPPRLYSELGQGREIASVCPRPFVLQRPAANV
eukprot:2259104-Pyramimonas_sp.AAC.1